MVSMLLHHLHTKHTLSTRQAVATAVVVLLSILPASVCTSRYRELRTRGQQRPCAIMESREGAQVVNATLQDFKFIHIPKTGGTSIEDVSRELGVQWGKRARAMMKVYSPAAQRTMCNCSPHHRMPRCMPGYYYGSPTFAVVRHPTLRFMSDFCWRNNFANWRLSPEALLDQMEQAIKQMSLGIIAREALDCHLIPQTLYTEAADFVLFFEELGKDFQCFTNLFAYGDVELPHRNPSSDFCKLNNLSFRNLSTDALRNLEDYYAKDFQVYGYERFSEPLHED